MSQVILFSEHFGSREKITKTNPVPIIPAIFRLATDLREKNISVATCMSWCSPFPEFESICRKLISEETAIVGISMTLMYPTHPPTSDNIDDLKSRIQIIKTIKPTIKVVVGGSYINERNINNDEDIRKIFDVVDIFVIGRGEEFLEKILDHYTKSTPLVTHKISPKTCIDYSPRHEGFENTTIEYTDNDGISMYDAVGIEYSRGCIFKCSFCSYPMLGKKPGDMQKGKLTLYDEFVRNYEEHGLTYYYFSDSLLNDSVERMQELADISSKLPFKLRYCAYVRLDLIRKYPEMADYLRDSGLITGIAGIETVNDESGKSVRKGLGVERLNETLEIIRPKWKDRVGINGNFILGLPYDTTETVDRTIEWLSTELVRDTIIDINIDALKIVTKEMTENQKFDYKIVESRDWVNRFGYSYTQAVADSKRVYKEFYSKLEVPVRFFGFDVAQLMAYSKKYNLENEMEQFYLTRKKNSIIQSPKEWHELRIRWHYSRINEYHNHLLNR